MKREILFRGKRIDNGEWVEGDLLSKCNGSPKISIHGEYNRGLFVVDSYEVIPETVSQWSGLHDKNGKKVFRDDKIEIITFDTKRTRQAVIMYGEFVDINSDDNYLGWFLEYEGHHLSLVESREELEKAATKIGTIFDKEGV